MRKVTFYTELAYLFGIAGLALGTAFMEKHFCFTDGLPLRKYF